MSGHRSHYPHPRAGQGETKTGKISLIKEIRYIPYGIFDLYGKIQKKTLYEWQKIFPWVQITFWALDGHDLTPVLGPLVP